MSKFLTSLKSIHSYIGCELIYREGTLIKHARLDSIKCSDEGIEFSLYPFESSGFDERLKKTFKIFCATEYLSFKSKYLFAAYVNWYIIVAPSAVKYLVRFAASKPEKSVFIKEINRRLHSRTR